MSRSLDPVPIEVSIAYVCHKTQTQRETFNKLSPRDKLDLIYFAGEELRDENNKEAREFYRDFYLIGCAP